MLSAEPDMSNHNLHLQVYEGRETGLMIIGNSDAFANLGHQLLEASAVQMPNNGYNWPHKVLVLDARSPYRDRDDYKVSFHLQSEPFPEGLLKHPRQAPAAAVLLGVAFLAVVGAVSLPIWLWKAFALVTDTPT